MSNVIKEKRQKANLSQEEMSKIFEIPVGTLRNWEQGVRTCPKYLEKLLTEKLEEIAMENAKEVLERAKELLEINELHNYIPELEIGEIVTLNDVWDGSGDGEVILNNLSFSYNLGNSEECNCEVWINYEFLVLEQKENILDTIIKITNIELI